MELDLVSSNHDAGEGKFSRGEPLLGCKILVRCDLAPVLVETICLTKDVVVLIIVVNDIVEDTERHRMAECL
jgi:hypothetical protein